MEGSYTGELDFGMNNTVPLSYIKYDNYTTHTIHIPKIKFEKVSYEQFKKDMNNFNCMIGEDLIKEYYNDLKLPRRATNGSAGYDFYMPFSMDIYSNIENDPIPTGIKCEIIDGYVLQLYPRSSMGYKYGMGLSNTVGIIDADYYNNPDNEGHISVKLTTRKNIRLEKGDRFVQGIFLIFATTSDDMPISDKRVGGTGSSGN